MEDQKRNNKNEHKSRTYKINNPQFSWADSKSTEKLKRGLWFDLRAAKVEERAGLSCRKNKEDKSE